MTGLGGKEWRDHVTLVGAVVMSWNHNVHQLRRVFAHLTGLEGPLADAIFFVNQSDSIQRTLIRRVAEIVTLAETDRQGLLNLLNRLHDVATARNLASHITFGVSAFDPVDGSWRTRVVPVPSPARDKRLQPDFTAQFEATERELRAIYDGFEMWLVNTPYPTRLWGLPPFLGGLDTPTDPTATSGEDQPPLGSV